MTSGALADLARRRLEAQRLVGRPFASPVDAVRAFGAVQAQDLRAATWALGQRTGATAAGIDGLCASGAILRTHVLRPTWHLVLPEDAGWLLELTGPRVRSGLRGRQRELGLDEPAIARAHSAFREALAGGRTLTRAELGVALRGAGIEPDVARLTHTVLTAELDRVVVSGPRRGAQHTYALFEDRVPPAPPLERTAALAELARRYFRSHGPARLADFAWWSGFGLAAARDAVAKAGPALERVAVDGAELWQDARPRARTASATVAHLIPSFDEYTVGYRDRSAIVDGQAPIDPGFFAFGSVLSSIVTIGGRVRGRWRRTDTRRGVSLAVVMLSAATPDEVSAIGEAARGLERFLERPVELSVEAVDQDASGRP
ncbi:MAG TPA: winged helix DNA-binding domain-containing protein [Candidatus Dormibacteraeota bacterium]|nr:winged helix DNA-binding domain-containing protein [Candidatus Dormibacteraeota bacterium]